MFYKKSLLFVLLAPSFAIAGWKNTLINLYNQHARAYQSSHRPSSYGSLLTERQAKNYVEQCIAALDHALRPHLKDRTLNRLKNLLLNNVLGNAQAYTWTSNGKFYNKDIVDQYINSALLEYIEDTSYNYAYKKTRDSRIARKIAESMRNNALARMQRYGALDAESLTPFVGRSLKRAVDDYINRFDTPYTTPYQAPQQSYNYETVAIAYPRPPAQSPEYEEQEKFYPSDACCVCLESFDENNNNAIGRVFLQPCGHDMCKNCAYQWFFVPSRNDAKTCPQCRSKVNLDKLSMDVASAPRL